MKHLLNNCPSDGKKVPTHCPLGHLLKLEKKENFVNNEEHQRHCDQKYNRCEPSSESKSLDKGQKASQVASRWLDEELVPEILS